MIMKSTTIHWNQTLFVCLFVFCTTPVRGIKEFYWLNCCIHGKMKKYHVLGQLTNRKAELKRNG